MVTSAHPFFLSFRSFSYFPVLPSLRLFVSPSILSPLFLSSPSFFPYFLSCTSFLLFVRPFFYPSFCARLLPRRYSGDGQRFGRKKTTDSEDAAAPPFPRWEGGGGGGHSGSRGGYHGGAVRPVSLLLPTPASSFFPNNNFTDIGT